MTEARMWERGGRRRRRGEQTVVPDATFSSYYGRPVLKRPVWQERDIAGYLFTGGLAAGSALLAAGADLQQLPELRRIGRVTAVGALLVSTYSLVHDLGRPERFGNMLRVFKPTSPMSVGSWLLTGFAGLSGVAMVAEIPVLAPRPLRPMARTLARPAGLAAAAVAPAIATYTAVLLADTSVPTWHAAYPELPFVFGGSAAAAASGWAMMLAPADQSRPARRLAALGSVLELAASQRMHQRLGLVGDPLREGRAGSLLEAARACMAGGALLAVVAGHRHRAVGLVAGATLVTGSALTRFGVFEAGVRSSEDPKYVVQPQRERLVRARRQGRRGHGQTR